MTILDRFFGPPPPKIEVEQETNPSDRLTDDPVRNGLHAEQLLSDPLLKQCFENVRQAYLRKFEQIGLGDVESLKMVHLSITALQDVRRTLLAYRFNGQKEIQKQEKQNNAISRPISRRPKQ